MATKKEVVNVPPQTDETVNNEVNMASETIESTPEVNWDIYFAPEVNERFRADLLKNFGQEITDSQEFAEIVKDFNRIFSKADGFKLFLNKENYAMQKGYPFTILVPLKFSSFDQQTMAQIGCHRVTFHLPSLSYLNVKTLLEMSLTTRANVLQYRKDNN